MPISIGVNPSEKARDRRFLACGEMSLGLFLSWSVVAASYHVEAIRSLYVEMTSFAPLGFIFTVILAPVWLGLRFVLKRYLPDPCRSLIAFIIPTAAVSVISLRGILALNQMWMTGPDY